MTAIPPLVDSNTSNIALEDADKANLLNNYFASISTIIDSDDDLPEFNTRTDSEITEMILTLMFQTTGCSLL